jgi:hypothetical protein
MNSSINRGSVQLIPKIVFGSRVEAAAAMIGLAIDDHLHDEAVIAEEAGR